MDLDQKNQVRNVVVNALETAEKFWKESGGDLEKEERDKQLATESFNQDFIVMDSIPSRIPNHELISEFKSINTELIALVADMRKSTNHAKSANGRMSPLKRIFLETSALLPAMETVINFEKGQVTEYLGDGVLGFFVYKTPEDVYKAHRAAKNIIIDMREILNDEIYSRYNLPKDINIGVGIAKSQAILYAAGLPHKKHPKAFGSCVYDATKLSSGNNIIGISKEVKAIWPTSSTGTLKFISYNFLDIFPGYKINPNT